jgi:hypothetical protein
MKKKLGFELVIGKYLTNYHLTSYQLPKNEEDEKSWV